MVADREDGLVRVFREELLRLFDAVPVDVSC